MKKTHLLLITIILFVCGLEGERFFHHSFEKFVLSMFQRIEHNPAKFSNRIMIIDTSPIYDLSGQRTDRTKLAAILSIIKLGQPDMVGLDIMLVPESVKDVQGDNLLKEVLQDWPQMIIPQGADPCFQFTDSSQLANIRIHDGYEIPVAQDGFLTLPFGMAAGLGEEFPMRNETFIVNYQASYHDLLKTEQVIRADSLIRFTASLDEDEREDELSMLLGSPQIILVGFCNEDLNVDRHATPLGKQPGILIWANALNNLLNSQLQIRYNPWWMILIWAIITMLIISGLKTVYEKYNFFYPVVYGLAALGQFFGWSIIGAWFYFLWQIYIPVFTFSLIAILAFPALLQVERLGCILDVLRIYRKVNYLPDFLRTGYIEYKKESNSFKQLHLVFTLIEECVRFSALLGLAQARSLGIKFKDIGQLDLSRLTFGQWQQMMRALSEKLKNHQDVLTAWKRIYYDQNEHGKWAANDLLKGLDGHKNQNILKNLDEKKSEREYLLKNLQHKSSWMSHLSYWGLRFLNLKSIQKLISFFRKDDSAKISKSLQNRFGEVKHLIQLRNRLVHSGGVFMENEEYQEIKPKFDKWLDKFLFEKLKFWQDARLVLQSNEKPEEIVLKLGNKLYQLYPFFMYKTCPVHFKEELFLLTMLDDKNNKLVYQGRGQGCQLMVVEEEAAEICGIVGEMQNFTPVSRSGR